MGITVNYTLRLKNERSLSQLIAHVRKFAAAHDWPVRDISTQSTKLDRSTHTEDAEYAGPSSGIEVLPDERCDPLRFEFGIDQVAQDFVKTQFAGLDCHLAVLGLLHELTPYLSDLDVEDEGEFWDTSETALLARNLAVCDRMLRDALDESPNARGPVRLPSGRWVDIIA